VTIDALNAGKHVYVEKPMTRYLSEAFDIYDTVKKTGKILQVGSRALPISNGTRLPNGFRTA
jgi:predicted dehydrogenase